MGKILLKLSSLKKWTATVSLTNDRHGGVFQKPVSNSHYFYLVTLVVQKLYTTSLITYIYHCHIIASNKANATNTYNRANKQKKIIQNDNRMCKSAGFTDSSSCREIQKMWMASVPSEITLFCVQSGCSPHDNNPTFWKSTPSCLFPKLQ